MRLNDANAAEEPPEVVVLLATYNGERFLQEQLDSILGQRGVSVRLVVMDDLSTDSTPTILRKLADRDPRVTVISPGVASGSAAANFYRLLQSSSYADDALIALSDQDDIWVPDKLQRHSELLRKGGFDGVSSNVVSFDETGRQTLVRKDHPQRAFDYLLQGPGPGSTFLMTGRLVNLTATLLKRPDSVAHQVSFQDSLLYAVCRARGWSWHIDSNPSVFYRQHDHNVFGSNTGLGPAWARFQLIREHWHRRQSLALATVALEVAPEASRGELARFVRLFERGGFRERITLARRAGELRRRRRDQIVIATLVAFGVW